MKKLSEVSSWIRARQFIYPASFTGERINDAVIIELLENANSAPSHRHTEPWRFHVLSDEKLADFSEFYQAAYKDNFTGDEFNQRKFDKIPKKLAVTSHLIIIGMQRDPEQSVPEWEEITAVGCAVQNIFLSMVGSDVGGYWSSPLYFLEKVKVYFDFSEGERCLGMLYLGRTKEALPPQVKKGPLDSKMKWYK